MSVRWLDGIHAELHEVVLAQSEVWGSVRVFRRVVLRHLGRSYAARQMQLRVRVGFHRNDLVMALSRSHIKGHYSPVMCRLLLEPDLSLVTVPRERRAWHSVISAVIKHIVWGYVSVASRTELVVDSVVFTGWSLLNQSHSTLVMRAQTVSLGVDG